MSWLLLIPIASWVPWIIIYQFIILFRCKTVEDVKLTVDIMESKVVLFTCFSVGCLFVYYFGVTP